MTLLVFRYLSAVQTSAQNLNTIQTHSMAILKLDEVTLSYPDADARLNLDIVL